MYKRGKTHFQDINPIRILSCVLTLTVVILRICVHVQYEHLSYFERKRAIGLKLTEVTNRKMAYHLSRNDTTTQRCLQE